MELTRRQFLTAAAGSMVAAGAMGLAACSPSGGSDAAAEDGVTKITFWCHENEAWTVSYEAMAEKFAAEHPEYQVVVASYPFSEYMDKVQTALSSSESEVDVMAMWGGSAPSFIETDSLSAVPSDLVAEFDSDYLAPTLGIYKKEGAYYGVPMEFNLEYGGLIMNKKLFDKAGLSYPTTWEELRKISGEVSKSEGDVVSMGGIEMIDGDALICNYLAMILQQGGQYIGSDNSVNFATPEGIAAMQEMVSMVKNGECSLEHLSMDDYCYEDVYADKAYGCSVGSWAISEGVEAFGLTYGEDFEYVQIPQYGSQMSFASETGWGLIVPANGKNVDIAWEFVKFFSDPENLVEHNIACAQLPPRQSMLDSKAYREAMPQVDFLLDILPEGQWMGPYNTSDMRGIFNDAFIDLCESDNPDYETVLKEASEKITAECQISYSME